MKDKKSKDAVPDSGWSPWPRSFRTIFSPRVLIPLHARKDV